MSGFSKRMTLHILWKLKTLLFVCLCILEFRYAYPLRCWGKSLKGLLVPKTLYHFTFLTRLPKFKPHRPFHNTHLTRKSGFPSDHSKWISTDSKQLKKTQSYITDFLYCLEPMRCPGVQTHFCWPALTSLTSQTTNN